MDVGNGGAGGSSRLRLLCHVRVMGSMSVCLAGLLCLRDVGCCGCHRTGCIYGGKREAGARRSSHCVLAVERHVRTSRLYVPRAAQVGVVRMNAISPRELGRTLGRARRERW